ncbi:hypothetical protein AYO27_13475 [Rhizobium sp. GHKF11]|nr:hypothetical protein AYO27_13475 [Rhizobium sp. GHKF11]
MANHIIKVPASTAVIKEFMNARRSTFIDDLNSIQGIITKAVRSIEVYKIYGRADKQGGDPLKNPRKVRLKFNDYFIGKDKKAGSVWSVPDIIGFTIVVTYPSDISKVCTIIDQIIDSGRLKATDIGVVNSDTPIVSKYGRAIVSGGYFACHYNVSMKRPGGAPICEIQIKTVLHDAWGAKSHDLTYKPSGRTSSDLIENFNLLGDVLANIDLQSDVIRRGIERTAGVRNKNKLHIMRVTIANTAQRSTKAAQLKAIVDDIQAGNCATDTGLVDKHVDTILEMFDAHPRESCVVYCYLATAVETGSLVADAIRALETMFEGEKKPLQAASSKLLAALANFSFGDTTSAIEDAEMAEEILSDLKVGRLSIADKRHLENLNHAVSSNLSYYHAERIGSHEGRLSKSSEHASRHLERSIKLAAGLGFPSHGLKSNDTEIERCLDDVKLASRCFAALDTEIFVRTQLAATVDEVNYLRERLRLIHTKIPLDYQNTAELLFAFHDFCARERLAELESS